MLGMWAARVSPACHWSFPWAHIRRGAQVRAAGHIARRAYPALSKLVSINPHDHNADTDSTPGHRCLLRAGYIVPIGKGLFVEMPLLHRVAEKLQTLVSTRFDTVGCQKMTLPSLCPKELWQNSGRWDMAGKELFRVKDRYGRDLCLSPTAEETITTVVANFLNSRRQLPLKFYQISRKFRDEIRPRCGLVRGREFTMFDLYTYHETTECMASTYAALAVTYKQLFDSLDIKAVRVEAQTGIMGGSESHEWLIQCPIGEDTLPQAFGEGDSATTGDGKFLEVGHTFVLGTKYTDALNVRYDDQNGNHKTPLMACFGIGVSRIMAALIERTAESHPAEVVWPACIAPYQVLIAPLLRKESAEHAATAPLIEKFEEIPSLANEFVIDDRRHLQVGKKIKTAYGLGIPIIVFAGRSWERDGLYECRDVAAGTSVELKLDEVVAFCERRSVAALATLHSSPET